MALSKITNASVADTAVHGRRNLVINGAMQVAQRGTSVASFSNSTYNTIDRVKHFDNTDAVIATSQSTEAPEGFSYSSKMNCTTADTTLDSGDYIIHAYLFENQDMTHLKWGTSNAQKVTLSFWVKSNKTGTYITELYWSSPSTHNSIKYTIDTADTWEHKTLTFNAPTTLTFPNNNGTSLSIFFWLAAGSQYSGGTLSENTWHSTDADRVAGQVNFADSTSNEWYITGVQLEAGDTATPFEHRSYGEELALCQRYYVEYKANNASRDQIAMCYKYDADDGFGFFTPQTAMRTRPTITYNDVVVFHNTSILTNTITINITDRGAGNNHNHVAFNMDNTGSLSAGAFGVGFNSSTTGYIRLDSEL
jgi:hypothetical protein